MIPINMNQAHIWYTYPEKVIDYNLLRSCFEMLSDEEKKQQQKLFFEKDRHIYLIAHSFVRMCLSRYTDVMPESLSFKKNRYGKPNLEHPDIGLSLKYNLSHTNGLIACIVTLQHEVGIDVENMNWDNSWIEIADKYFSHEEVYNLSSLPLNRRRIRFYELWTLKESYMKAKGIGLSMLSGKFSFQIKKGNTIWISFRNNFNDSPGRWQFFLYRIKPNHMCATAIECGDIPIEIIIREDGLLI